MTTGQRIEHLLTAAADLIARGYKVLPLCGKSCKVLKWQTRRFTLDQIAERLRRYAARGLEPNIGVAMGPGSGPAGLIDFEYDSAEQLADLHELFGGQLPSCPSFKATRGNHYLFAFPAEFREFTAGSIHFGLLEIKLGAGGKGSQSAFPPSTNREWILTHDEMDPPQLPPAVVAKLLPILRKKSEGAPLGEWSEHRWTVEQIEETYRYLADKFAPAVGGNGREKKTFAVCCEICRRIGNAEQAADLWDRFDSEHCVPSYRVDKDQEYFERQLRRAYEQVGAAAHAKDCLDEIRPAFRYKIFTGPELLAADFRVDYLIKDVMVAGQPMLIAGPSKSLKTSLMLDAAIALAGGLPWLDTFEVLKQCPVVVMSGESGLPVLKQTLIAQCLRRGKTLADLPDLLVSGDLPDIGAKGHDMAVREILEYFNAKVLIIDPLYLALPGDDAANASVQGRLLQTLAKVCEQLAVVLVVAAHTKKLDHFNPLALNDVAYAAAPQFAGQWWLVNRREKYAENSGEHRLWLSIGGRAWFSSAWAVDVKETRPEPEFGIVAAWGVTVTPSDGATASDKQRKAEGRLKTDIAAVERFLTSNRDKAFSKTKIADKAGVHPERINACISYMLAGNDIRTAPSEHPKAGCFYQWSRPEPGILAAYSPSIPSKGLGHPSSSPSPVRATMKKMEQTSILAGTESERPSGEYATAPRGRVVIPPQKGPAAFPRKGGEGSAKSTRGRGLAQ